MQATFINIDNTPELAHLQGEPITIVDVLSNMEDPTHINDTSPGSLPMFRVVFNTTNTPSNLFPDEVPEEQWTEPMKAVIAGMQAFGLGVNDNPYPIKEHAELHQRFLHGLRLAEFKSAL